MLVPQEGPPPHVADNLGTIVGLLIATIHCSMAIFISTTMAAPWHAHTNIILLERRSTRYKGRKKAKCHTLRQNVGLGRGNRDPPRARPRGGPLKGHMATIVPRTQTT